MLKKTLVIGLALIGALWVNNVSAQRNYANMKQNKAQGYMNLIPNLTDEQAEKINALRLEHQKTMLELKTSLAEKGAKYVTLTTGSSVDVDAAKKLIEEMAAIKLQMAQARLDHRMAVRKLLTEEQQLWYDHHFVMKHKQNQGPHKGQGYGMHSGQGNGQGLHDGKGPHGTGRRNANPDCPNYSTK